MSLNWNRALVCRMIHGHQKKFRNGSEIARGIHAVFERERMILSSLDDILPANLMKLPFSDDSANIKNFLLILGQNLLNYQYSSPVYPAEEGLRD